MLRINNTKLAYLMNFLRSGTAESSKRLLTIISYVSAIVLGWYSLVTGKPIDGNLLILVLGLAGASTTQQILKSGKEQ